MINKSMLNSIILCATLLFCAFRAESTVFVSQSTTFKDTYPALVSVNDHALNAYHVTSNKMAVYAWQRDISGWKTQKKAEVDLSSFSGESQLVLQWVSQDGSQALLTNVACTTNNVCEPTKDILVDVRGSMPALIKEQPLSCEKKSLPVITSGAGVVTWMDACGSYWTINAPNPWKPSEAVVMNVARDQVAKWVIRENSVDVSLNDVTMPTINFDEKIKLCQWTGAGMVELYCEGVKPYRASMVDGSWHIKETTLVARQSSIAIDDHVYRIRTSQTETAISNTSSKSDDASAMFSERKMASVTSTQSTLWKWQATPLWVSSMNGFYVVTPLMTTQNKIDFIWFDGRSINHPPYFFKNTISVPSGKETTSNSALYDEDDLTSTLTVAVQSSPSWATLNQKNDLWTLSPAHKDSGSHHITGSVSDPKSAASNFDIVVDVSLTPSVVMAFEPSWFKLWKIDEPIPLNKLLLSTKNLPLLEDQATEWKLTAINRDPSEFQFEVLSKPEFMAAAIDGGSLVLSGTPKQPQVGDYVVKVKITDAYKSPEELDLQIRVIEVDEPFTITSTPVSKISSDSQYSYHVETDDEESSIQEMSVNLVAAPSFLKWNASTSSIEGKAERKDVGSYPIAILVIDPAGHRVVQQWTLTVELNEQSQRKGGSITFSALLFLSVLIFFRKFQKKCCIKINA